MRPLAKRHIRKDFGTNGNSPTAIPEPAQNGPEENAVPELLGVMYTSQNTQPPREVDRHGREHLLLGVDDGRRSTDVIFHDPVSSRGGDEPSQERLPRTTRAVTWKPKRRRTRVSRQITRAQAIEVVIRELADLSTRMQGHERWTRAEGLDGMD